MGFKPGSIKKVTFRARKYGCSNRYAMTPLLLMAIYYKSYFVLKKIDSSLNTQCFQFYKHIISFYNCCLQNFCQISAFCHSLCFFLTVIAVHVTGIQPASQPLKFMFSYNNMKSFLFLKSVLSQIGLVSETFLKL